MDPELIRIFAQFFDAVPIRMHTIDTSRGDDDFRTTVIIETGDGSKYVLKLAENDFTVPERIIIWERTVLEYRKLGCFCPLIYRDKLGRFSRHRVSRA